MLTVDSNPLYSVDNINRLENKTGVQDLLTDSPPDLAALLEAATRLGIRRQSRF
jgi:hypothetical protein